MSGRSHTLRALYSRLFSRRLRTPAVPRTRLVIVELEDRVVPQAVDVGGLRFSTAGTFNATAVAGGTQYDTALPIDVGLVPTGAAAFKPLLELPGGGIVKDVGAASTFLSTAPLEGITGTAHQAIAAAQQTFTIAQVVPGAAGASLTPAGALAVAGQQFTPSGLRFDLPAGAPDSAAATVDLAGSLALASLGNAVLPVTGKANEAYVAIGAAGQTAAQFVEAAASLDFPNPFKVGGLTFSAGGVKIAYDPTDNKFSLFGTASFPLGGGTVSISLGDAADPGVVVTNGSLTSLNFGVTSSIKAGGVTFSTDSLGGKYDSAAGTITITGGAKFELTSGNTVDVNFGADGTSGLVLENGSLTQAGFVTSADLKLGGLTFTADKITAQYTAPDNFTLTGAATAKFKNVADVTVNFGGNNTSGLVIENGSVTKAGFAVDGQVKVGGLTFTATGLTAQYEAPNNFTLTGTAAAKFKNIADVSVNFGGNSTSGIVVEDGTLTKAGFVVDGKVSVGGVEFTAQSLTAQYTAPNNFTLTGTATAKFKNIANLSVNFGGNNQDGNPTSGIVVEDGTLTQAGFVVDSTFTIGGATFKTKTLAAQYTAPNNFTLSGGVKFAYKGVADIDVTLGRNGTSGLVIVDGSLSKLGFAVDSKIVVKGLTFTTDNLAFDYQAQNAAYGNAATYTLSGRASIKLKGVDIKVMFGKTDSFGQTSQGLVIANGDLKLLDATVDSNFKFSNVQFGTKALRLQYTNDSVSRFVVTGSAFFSYMSGGTNVNLTAQFGGKVGQIDSPGLVIENGDLKELLVGVTGQFKVKSIDLQINSLAVRYVADQSLFEMYGGVKLNVGTGANRVIKDLGVQLGQVDTVKGQSVYKNPGIRIVNGTLEQLDIQITPGSTLNFGSVRVDVDKELGLRLRYWKTSPTTNTEQINITGGVGVSIARKFTGRAAFIQNGLIIDLTTGEVKLDGLRVTVGDITYKVVTLKELTVEWKRNGSSFDLAASGTVYVGLPSNPAMKAKASFEIVAGKLRSIKASLVSGGQGIGPLSGSGIDGSLEISGLDDLNENFLVTGTLNVNGPKLTLPGGNSISYYTLSGTFTFTTQYLEVKGFAKFAGGLFSGDGRVRVNFNPGGDETIPEKFDDPGDALNNAKAGGTLLFATAPTRTQALEKGIAAINQILDAYNGQRAKGPGSNRGAGSYTDYRRNNVFKVNYNTGDFPYNRIYTDRDRRDRASWFVDVPQKPGIDKFGKDGFYRLLAEFATVLSVNPDVEREFAYVKKDAYAQEFYLGQLLYEAYAQRDRWVADLRKTIDASSNARYRGRLTEGDPNNDPDVKKLLKPGQRIDVRIETENSSDATGSQTFVRQTKVYSVYTPAQKTGRRLPEVEGNINLSLYAGFVTLGANFSISKQTGFYIDARMSVQIPNKDGVPKPIRGLTFGQFEGKLKLAIKDGKLSPSDSYVDLTVRKILFFVNKINLHTSFDGKFGGLVDVKFIPDIRFGPTQLFPNFFTKTAALTAATPAEQLVTAAQTAAGPTTLEELQAADPTVVTVADEPADADVAQINIVSVTPIAGTPDALVTYQVDAPDGGESVSLYTSQTEGDTDFGVEFADGLPAAAGPQTFVWKNFAEYGPTPYDPTVPLYVYGVLRRPDGGDDVSPFSVAVAVPNYDPTLTAPRTVKYRASADTATTTFTAATGTAISVGDPLPADEASPLVLILSSSYGTFDVTATAANVTVDGNGGDFVTLVGSAADLTAALEGLTYTSRDGQHYDDEILLSLQRSSDEQPGTVIKTVDVDPLSVTVSLDQPSPAAADGIAWTPAGGFAGPTIAATSFAAPQPVFPTVGIDTAAASSIDAARVRVLGYVPGRDVLSLPDTFDAFDVNWDPAHGVLTLTGAADPAVYEQAIHALTFATTAGAGSRTLELTVQDGTGTPFAVTFPLTVAAGDAPPTLTASHPAAAFDSVTLAPVPIDADLTLADDGGTLAGAAVRFMTPANGAVLTFTPAAGIAGVYDAGTGTLTLFGTASVAAYQAVLRSVAFDANGSVPYGTSGFLAAVAVRVTDGTKASAPQTYGVFVPSDFDQPLGVALGDVPTTFALNEDETDLLPAVVVTSPSEALILSATVRIADGYTPGEDELTAGDLPGGIRAAFDATAGVLRFVGLASAEDYTTALQSVRYANRAAGRSGAARTFELAVNDGQYGKTVEVTTLEVDAAPVVMTGLSETDYAGGKATLTVASDLLVDYRGDGSLTGATVQLLGNFDSAADVLTFDAVAGIAGVFDPTAGTLTFTGAASAETYQALLRSVRFQSLRADVAAFDRLIGFTVSTAAADSDLALGTVTVHVVPADAPDLVTGTTLPTAVAEGGATVAPLADLTLTDPDAGMAVEDEDAAFLSDDVYYSATVAIAPDAYVGGEDALFYTASDHITGQYDPDVGILFLTGEASAAEYQQVLRSVTYQNRNASPSTAARTLTVYLEDGSGNGPTFTTTIAPQNNGDTPTLTAGAVPTTIELAGDQTSISLGLDGITYAPSAGLGDLVYTIVSVPDATVGKVVLADGTVAAEGATTTLDQLRGAKYVSASDAAQGAATFAFSVAAMNPLTGQPDTFARLQSIAIIDDAPPEVSPPVIPTPTLPNQYAVGGPTGVTVYDAAGAVVNTYTPFPGFTGGVRSVTADFNGDGVPDVVAAAGPGRTAELQVIDGATGAVLFTVQPFEGFAGGLNVATGDLTGDGTPDLAVAADQGGGPRVQLYDGKTFAKIADFFGIDDPNFRGGARVAVGDFNADGFADLVVAAGFGGGPRVAVYDGHALLAGGLQKLVADFFAFEDTLRNGATVAAGDVTGDGVPDLVFGAGPGGGPRVLVLDGAKVFAGGDLAAAFAAPVANFFAGNPDSRLGVTVAAKDLNGDATADLVAATDKGGKVEVVTYLGPDLSPADTYDLDVDSFNGAFVG